MEEIRIKAETRRDRGKGPARRLRRQGTIPGILYGRDVEPVALSISAKDWRILEDWCEKQRGYQDGTER